MPPDPNDDPNILEKYAINLNQKALDRKLDPIIGRQAEINRVIRILSRRGKNNPVLIGEPGVGKTAIVEGLVQRIIKNDVPTNLLEKKIYELDMGLLVAGAKFHGEFEERLKAVLKKIKDSNGQIILFIDELHLIVGAGRTQGSMDASNLLKPMLARGELHCIGATTFDEYRQYIEKDSALERRFQKIVINEPTIDESITILRRLKPLLESFHGVVIRDSAIVAAVELSTRYINDRYLPDKAIDLIDEASAAIKTQIASVPLELDNLNRDIMQYEIEKAALSKESDKAAVLRLTEINNQLKTLKKEQTVLQKQWDKEHKVIKDLKQTKKDIETSQHELEETQNQGNFARAGELKYSILPSLEKKLVQLQADIKKSKLIKEDVTNHEIADIVAKWTGIPVTKILTKEHDKLIHLPELLEDKIKGQDHAIKILSEAILRSRSGIKDPTKPIGTFLFLGPTGVGKTELAKVLTDVLFNSRKNFVQLDMSEYMEKHSVSKLIGAPPGYVGYDQGGSLTEAIRHKPYSIVLFDEIEKAHPDVINLLLQIMDEGVLTDSRGKKVNFCNTIIIMTSNIGSKYVMSTDKNMREKLINKELSSVFRPELLNRIDNNIIFNGLPKEVVYEIIDKELEYLDQKMQKLKNMHVSFTQEVKDYIFKHAYDEEFGVRPVKRFIKQVIETVLAHKIINNEITAGQTYVVLYENNEIQIKHRSNKNLN